MDLRKRSIADQVHNGLDFLKKRYGADHFMLYFQSYSTTYGSVSELREIYDFALGLAPFCEMIIATRPDCIDRQRIELIASYRSEALKDIWVELGLQSAHESSLRHIRRGHTVKSFCDAVVLLKEARIKVCAHLILGLPAEGYEQMAQTAALITRVHPDAVKIHNLHIPSGTRMYEEYLDGEIISPSGLRHLSYTIFFLERIPSDIIIQRLICDTPAHRLAAPLRFPKKGSFITLLREEMARRDTWQGKELGEPYHEL
ncbi:MAG: TIGR01212 family radical SAM protein [Spirochaetia bacterium]|nr:TIGR01212 family radical SAM protein [Spirochaetia bacterium]